MRQQPPNAVATLRTHALSCCCRLESISTFNSLARSLVIPFAAHGTFWLHFALLALLCAQATPAFVVATNELPRRTSRQCRDERVSRRVRQSFGPHSALVRLSSRLSPLSLLLPLPTLPSLLIVSVIRNDCAFIVYLRSGHGSGLGFAFVLSLAGGGGKGDWGKWQNA